MAFPRFLIAGAVNTGLTYLLYLGLSFLIPYLWAYSFSYAAGIGLGYTLNSRWVFVKTPGLGSATAYPLTYALNYLLGAGILSLLVELMNIPKEVAPLIVVAITVPVMYIVTKWIFQGKSLHEKINNQ